MKNVKPFKPRHYCGFTDYYKDSKQGVVQIDLELTGGTWRYKPKDPFKMSETVLRLAHAEYERQYPGQDYERVQERGGLSIIEIVNLLADYVERLGGKPSTPRKKD
jgi:hypothetical protein